MKNSFKKELQKEISKKFTIVSIVLAFFFLCFFYLYIIYMQNYQVERDSISIYNRFSLVKEKSYQLLEDIEGPSIELLLNNDKDRRGLYSAIYHGKSERGINGDILVLNADKEAVFSTNENYSGQISLPYLKTAISANPEEKIIERVSLGYDGNHYMFLIRPLIRKGTAIGYEILTMNGADFQLEDIRFGTQYVIADQYDNVLSKNSSQLIVGSLKKFQRDIFREFFFTLNGNLYLTKIKELANGIVLFSYIPLVPVQVFVVFSLGCILCLVSFMIYMSFHLAHRIAERNTSSIEKLVQETGQIQMGQKNKILLDTGDEFQYLAMQINEMLAEVTRLNEQKLHLEKEKLVFERRMLESQFNPHFLYNTLETIRITTQIDPQLSARIISLLNKILRYSIDHARDSATVEDDFKIIEDFLAVNAIRFDKFSYALNIQTDIRDMSVPRLFLLPIIENSLKYGMRSRSDLSIEILVYRDKGEIFFEVQDNGPGFSEHDIQKIYFSYENIETQHGLINSFKRLRIMYPYCDLRIENKDHGASVKFVINEEVEDV